MPSPYFTGGTPAAGRSGSSSSTSVPCGEHATMYSVFSACCSDRRTKPNALEDLPTSGSSSDGGHRAERVARYKEERRRQLASQYGVREEPASTPPRRYITRSAVKNGDSSEQHAKVRTTKTSRLRAAATSPTEASVQANKDTSGTPTRNGKDSVSTPPRKDSRETSSPIPRSLSVKDSPRKDIALARSQSGKDLLRDSSHRTGLTLSKSQSGKDLIKDMSLSPRPHTSMVTRSQSGKDIKDSMGLSPRHPAVRETSGSPSSRESKDGGSPLRSLPVSSRTRRVGVSEKRGLTASSGSSEKEKSPAQLSSSDGTVSSTRKEKDKSSKRKSNLNRSTTEEVVPVDPDEDSSAIRRRRRRVEAHGGNIPLNNLDGGPSASHSSRSESSPQSDLPPSRAMLRLTADSSSHFLQARRLTPPVASSPSPTPPAKLKPGASLSVYSGGSQPEARTDRISQRADRLVSSAKDAVTRLNKLSSESSKISDGSDNRELLSGLGESSSSSIDTNANKTVKSDTHRNAEHPAKKSRSQSPECDFLQSQIPVKSTDTSPLENGFVEVPPRSRTGSPNKPPSSILKKKSLEEQFPIVTSSSGHQMPVSILKRKTSQEEGGCASLPPPPVTFCPSVLEQSESKRQGILKKRCSLDESEVLRRRSCSPDMAGWDGGLSSEFRPILKNQRRSSLEELVRRTLSPDPQPQSILKRRTSRDDEIEERTSGSPEPQGILKRKSATSSSSSSSSTSPHVSIAASVIMNVAGLDPSSDLLPLDGSSEQVRPILKKKSSSEENTTADSSSTEAPKPILKKKTSADVDDLEEKPMKPILKSSRKSSQEEQSSWESASSMESPVRCLILRSRSLGGSDSASGSDCEVVRPILKQPSSDRSSRERSASPRHRLSFCDDQEDRAGSAPGSRVPSDESRNVSPSREGVILRRRLKQSSVTMSSSSSSVDNELSAILNKRRSLETSADAEQDSAQVVRSRSPIVVETPRGLPRPMSVAERILNMENFMVQDSSAKATGAVPKRPGSLRAFRDRERFHTQPITLHELHASSRLESVKAFQKGILEKKTSTDSRLVTSTPPPSAPDAPSAETPVHEPHIVPLASKEKHPSAIPDLGASGDSLSTSTPPASPKTEVAMNSHGDDGSKASEDDAEGLLKLCRSNSVVARASLFAQLEEDMKRAAEEANSRKIPKGSNRGVARYKARREESSSRFATQPVTLGEVQEAVRTTTSSESTLSEGKQKVGDEDDDEPSQLSLAERVKLFNQKIQEDGKTPVVPKQPPPTRKRLGPGSRFKTQPVTTEEVVTATQRISPLAASLAKPPDPKLLGGMSARAARDKMYEHASAVLARSSSSSRIVTDKEASATENVAELESDVKPKGILKHLRDLESRSSRSPSLTEAAISSEMDTESESDVKGILKSSGTPVTSGAGTPELESFRHLKSVLKKENSSSITDTQSQEDIVTSATNDQLHSILKPESKEWDDSSSSGSESSSETELPARPLSAPTRNSLDLISILHNVEANARKERQALMSSPNNKPPRPSSNEEKLMNLRNLRHEKENHQGLKEKSNYERRKIEMDSKLSSETNCVKPSDLYLDHKSLVKQRKLESKFLVEELSMKSIEKHHNLVSEKNHSLSNVRLLDANYVDHKSLVNQKKLESKKLVEELTSRKNVLEMKKCAEEDEAALYERQLRRQIEELQRLSSSPNDTPTPPTSDGETSSSGGREVRRIIRNEAVARRRQAALARQQQKEANNSRSEPGSQQQQQQLLKKSKSHSSVSSSDQQERKEVAEEEDGFVKGGIKRSYTQPLTEQELRDADENDAMSGASIAQRLAALQKSGNTDWRKRVSKLNPEDDLTIICNTTHITNHHHRYTQETRVSEKVVEDTSNVSILADRLGKLDAAKQGWKKRVGPTDAVQFSVAGRMMMENTRLPLTPTVPASPPTQLLAQPSTDRKRRTPRAERFRSKAALRKEIASTPSSPQKELTILFKRSMSAPGGDDETGMDLSVDRNESFSGPKVAVPRLDDETFTSFFNSSISSETKSHSTERLDICLEDLDQIVSHSSKLSVQKRTVRVQRKAMSSRNPIKALAARTDLQDEYMDVRTGVAEKELKRIKVEKLAKNSTLAVEALAGLASREDFTAVNLKKAASPSNGNMLPYKDLMLLQVKGRRHVQTRLVEPIASSINSGDNYVLVTPSEVYNYIGRYSNVIERSRGAEVAMNVQQKKDLGSTSSRQVITVSEEKPTCSSTQVQNFWKLLGGSDNRPAGAGHPDEDELYESAIIATNMVYELQDDELVPMDEYWGGIPKIEMLDPSKILVFDFGSELYVWNGKNAPLDKRRVAQSLVRELWAEGFDYSECDVCPITAASMLGSREDNDVESRGPARPSWALLAKVTQHMETILFREKFLDWPDFSRVIRTKGGDDEEKQVDASIDVKPCDVTFMLEPSTSEPDLELEGSHVGRGSQYFDEENRRHHEIRTLGVTVWHILEYEHTELPESSVGHFHRGDSYVVRWLYNITVTGRELSGQPSRHSVLGRDRCAYFCWQGKEASLNEQGAAALLTVELDRERGPQVRVVQGMEPPAFLSLFKGSMVVHAGKREEEDDHESVWRLYVCRGELQQEAVLVEVPCSVRQLRSRASLVLVNTSTGVVFVWHGAKTQLHTRKIALASAEELKTRRPVEVGFTSGVEIAIQEIHEGSENSKFFRGMGGANRHLYVSLLDNPRPFNKTPRLFHLSSLSGTFCSTEVLGPYRSTQTVTAFPFLQSDLYSASQPALFLLDNNAGDELWLWQGWWPDYQGEETEGCDARGSAAVRWQAERRAAMQTALDYWRSHHSEKEHPVAYLVWAGLEPLQFTNLFPIWTDRDDIAEINIRDGRKPGEVLKVEDELARLTRSTYPVAQLLQRPLPDGVDPTHLEFYLDPQHFEELLGMSKEEFLELPTWKQTKIKKEVGLF